MIAQSRYYALKLHKSCVARQAGSKSVHAVAHAEAEVPLFFGQLLLAVGVAENESGKGVKRTRTAALNSR